MRNPAIELADRMSGWYGESVTPVEVRGGQHPGDTDFWRKQAEAVELLREVERAIKALPGDVSFYDSYIAEWYRIIFSFSSAWGVRGKVGAPDASAIAMLRGLGASLTLVKPATEIVSEAQRETLRDCVAEAFAMLEDVGEGLAPGERAYVFRLLGSIRDLLEQRDILGEVDLQALIDQLVGALVGISAQFVTLDDGESERSSKVRTVISRFASVARGFTHDTAAVAAIASGVIDVTKAITGAN